MTQEEIFWRLSQTGCLWRLVNMDEPKDTPEVVWDGLLAVLDQLPMDARIAFLLSEVFEMRANDVAALLRSDAQHCRELIEQARAHIQSVRDEQSIRRGTL